MKLPACGVGRGDSADEACPKALFRGVPQGAYFIREWGRRPRLAPRKLIAGYPRERVSSGSGGALAAGLGADRNDCGIYAIGPLPKLGVSETASFGEYTLAEGGI
jgi:hypothetical protein